MATASCLLTEENVLCSVCLQVFTNPVTTPCGHNYCQACINKYWDNALNDDLSMCTCPVCNNIFFSRPHLQVNTILSVLALQINKSVKVATPDSKFSNKEGVLCDVCYSEKDLAVQSCLMCLASFCKQHLEPHLRLVGQRSHILVEPEKNLDHIMCKTHNKITELYCRTDNICICVLCIKTDHRSHKVVSLEEEYEAVMAKKDEALKSIRTRIQLIRDRIRECENSVGPSQQKAEREKKNTMEVFGKLICSIHKYQAELVDVIENRHLDLKKRAEGCISEMQMAINHLQSNERQLEHLSQSKDRHSFLERFSSLTSLLPKNWAANFNTFDMSLEKVREAVDAQYRIIERKINEIPQIRKRMEEALQKTLNRFQNSEQ